MNINDKTVFLVEMGKRIAARRKQLGLTQEELADKISVTPQLISTAERGIKALRPENLSKISTALGVSADYLLKGIDSKELSTSNSTTLTAHQKAIIETVLNKCIELA